MHRLFPSQQENEQIYLVVREHWFFLFLKFAIVLLLFGALIAFQDYGPNIMPILFAGTAAKVVTMLSELYIIGLVAAIFLLWVLYYLNIQIITNLRVVDIDQRGLLSRRISELHIDKIEDATSEISGLLGNIFQYGNVNIQTAGTLEHFQFYRIPAPDKVEQLILDLYEKRPKTLGD